MSSSVLEHNFSSRLARELELVADKLEQWISAEHKWPFDPILVQQLQQLLGLLKHEVQRLKAGKVYVVIVLMGGTGVGKSTLLNALAGQPIARNRACCDQLPGRYLLISTQACKAILYPPSY
jgi:putative ribosome biogenesis GTPase RsgA